MKEIKIIFLVFLIINTIILSCTLFTRMRSGYSSLKNTDVSAKSVTISKGVHENVYEQLHVYNNESKEVKFVTATATDLTNPETDFGTFGFKKWLKDWDDYLNFYAREGCDLLSQNIPRNVSGRKGDQGSQGLPGNSPEKGQKGSLGERGDNCPECIKVHRHRNIGNGNTLLNQGNRVLWGNGAFTVCLNDHNVLWSNTCRGKQEFIKYDS